MDFQFKSNYNIDDLLKIVCILRSDIGCPWDKKQSHKSLRQNFIEETYEVIEAIDNNDTDLLLEELGDVLLQVVFHAQLESEVNNFNFDDVADGICKKLIVRHPHVFSDTKVKNTDEVLDNWEKIKAQTKNQNSQLDAINSIAKTLPALMRTFKVLKKASKINPDLKSSSNAINNLIEKSTKLTDSSIMGNDNYYYSIIGELLISVVQLAMCLNVDPELALTDSCNAFINKL